MKERLRAWVPTAMAAAIAGAPGVVEAADFVGFVGEPSIIDSAGVEYSVIDVYAEFAQSTVVVVNAFNASISNTGATAFHHSDLNTFQSLPGTWSPGASLALPGLDPAVDSFVIIGGSPGSANTTALDPNFSPATAPIPPANAGWYNSNPPNAQGVASASGRVFIGRFVVVGSATPDTLAFTASVTFADYVSGTTGSPQQGTDSISVTYAAVACDSLAATAAATTFDSAGSASNVSVSVDVASPLCSWSASDDADWVSLIDPSGSGDGSFSFAVDANPSTVTREATITVTSGTATDVEIVLTQEGLACAVTEFTPATAGFGSSGGDGSTIVSTNGPNCSWSATSDASWLVITSGASGTGT
ncbi:MAG: BACON domain-containing protein, partial [Phycisphaerales bacterium]